MPTNDSSKVIAQVLASVIDAVVSKIALSQKTKKKVVVGKKRYKFKIKLAKQTKPDPPILTKKEQKAMNKALEAALKKNKPKDIKSLVENGGRFEYNTLYGIEISATKGNLEVIKALFVNNLAQNYLKRVMIEDMIDALDEFKPKRWEEVTRYLVNHISEVPELLFN